MHLLPILSTILSLTAAISIPREADCLGVDGVKAFLTNPAQGGPAPFNTIVGKGTYAECRSACFSAANAKCKTFSVRPGGTGGACYLYDEDLSSKLKPNAASTYTYYVLPGGVRGDVPENVAQHYYADISKTKGSYEACRALCLSDVGKCKGFGFREGRNCQLYDVSLRGRVKAKENALWIQYYADCNGA